VLDFLWLKHQSFNDTLEIILQLFPHRTSTGTRALQPLEAHIRKHRERYERMDMTLKGEGIVRRLKELGLLTDDGQIKIGEASGSKIKEG
jgi:hypothetical protein